MRLERAGTVPVRALIIQHLVPPPSPWLTPTTVHFTFPGATTEQTDLQEPRARIKGQAGAEHASLTVAFYFTAAPAFHPEVLREPHARRPAERKLPRERRTASKACCTTAREKELLGNPFSCKFRGIFVQRAMAFKVCVVLSCSSPEG